MKKVWVNRYNADGLFKPMSEWKLKECNQNQSHAYKVASGNYAFNFECLPSRHCLITPQGENEESGVFFEFIGNQRGDGWFNVEDEQPPTDVLVLVLRDPQHVKELTQDDVAIGTYWSYNDPSFGHTFELSEGGCWVLERCDTLLWQPIQPPKHLD